MADTVPPVTTGRGAWTVVGKDNGSKYYEYVTGKPLDGARPSQNVNYQAVNLGVKALQARINALGYSPRLLEDGVLGGKSKVGIEWVQRKLGLTADGQAGPATMKALWRDLVVWFAAVNRVPAAHVWGVMMAESMADPGAVGYTTPSDRGLVQINLSAHTNITVQEAFDPIFSLNYLANRISVARDKFSQKGVDLQNKCSIAQHNSPLWAKQWYDNGQPPNAKIASYVEKILALGQTLK